ncbi:MAG: cytochrome c3 family protein [Elusimicrobiota bacterium]
MVVLVAALVPRAPRPDADFKDLRDAVGDRARCPESAMPHRQSSRTPLWGRAQTAGAPGATSGMRTMHYCLSCHDGVVVGSSKSLGHAAATTANGTPAGHPVDVDYAAALAGKPDEYRDPATNPRIHLEAGKVTCLSCHESRGSIAALRPGGQTDICLTCHKK